MQLNLRDLYRKDGAYPAINIAALIALVAGIVPVLLGLLIAPLRILYDTGWFAGFGIAFVVYTALMMVMKNAGKDKPA